MGSETTLIGRTFAGRYRISGLIGEGGMATVYRGELIVPAATPSGGDARPSVEPQTSPAPIPSGPALSGIGGRAAGSAATATKRMSGAGAPPASNGPSLDASTPPPAEQSSNDALAQDDPNATTDVAIKVMNAQLARDATFVKRFQREAKAAARLKHRSTVRIHSWGVEDGLPYIVMELIPGAELVRILHHEKRLPEARAARIMAQVCSALAAAHDLGIVHRDLKPENVMVVRDPKDPTQDRIKVLDFGIAKTLEPEMRPPDALPMDSDEDGPPSSRSALTMVGTLVGTPEYMSPEQARGTAVDTRSDIYTCGVLLYQMVTGRVPFTGDTPFEIAIRQVEETPKPPSSLVRGLSPRLENLILRAVAKAPGDRPQSAREMQEELLEMLPELSNNPAQSMHPGPAPRPAAGRASRPDAVPKLMTPAPDSDQAVTRRFPAFEMEAARQAPGMAPPTPAAGAPPPPRTPPATVRMPAEAHAAAAAAAAAAGIRPAAGAPPDPTALAATADRTSRTDAVTAERPARVDDARLDPPTPLGARQIKRRGLSNAAALGLGVLLGGAIIALLTLVLTMLR
jgi:serine/threonine-protein kinase